MSAILNHPVISVWVTVAVLLLVVLLSWLERR
jgi:hypothetical protein